MNSTIKEHKAVVDHLSLKKSNMLLISKIKSCIILKNKFYYIFVFLEEYYSANSYMWFWMHISI